MEILRFWIFNSNQGNYDSLKIYIGFLNYALDRRNMIIIRYNDFGFHSYIIVNWKNKYKN